MALQHFYSRVPARVSMFNKADGFDTFACSWGLSREFIEKEIAPVYDNKLSGDELALVRNDRLPPVYTMSVARGGELLLSSTGFMPSDYTGERSSYLVHTLVMGQEEKAALLGAKTSALFNPSVFTTVTDSFNLTGADAKPVSDYPELEYVSVPLENTSWLTETYDANMLKRFIYALLVSVSGKGKPVYVVLPVGVQSLSVSALRFMNTIIAILPAHLRGNLSFSTYVGDYTRLPGFNVKFMTYDAPAVPPAKGVTINFGSKMVFGMKDEDVSKEIQIVEFFYSLLGNDIVRREFLAFTGHATAAAQALAAANLKTLADLVFLFRCSSGMFDEKSVLQNDDRVYDLMCVYEKYRVALSEENKIAAMKCLQRYPASHTAIPKNVFSKVSKTYPSETPAVKRVIMNIVLDLIHTDIMRDKLFTFIKNNYAAEQDDMKININNDLCRVFYGGFLQPQILDFFARNFPSECSVTKDAVLDKILLAIRTKAIQPQILDFLRHYYGTFTLEQTERIYAMVMEMLPEGDELARALIDFIDSNIGTEPDYFKSEIAEQIASIASEEQRRREHPFIKCVTATGGFSESSIIRHMFNDWISRKIFAEYVDCIASLPMARRADVMVSVYVTYPYMAEANADKFIAELERAYGEHADKSNAYALIEAEQTFTEKMAGLRNEHASEFAKKYTAKVMQPMVVAAFNDIFKVRTRKDADVVMAEYAETHEGVAEMPQFALAHAYIDFVQAAKKGDIAKMIWRADSLAPTKSVGQSVAAYMEYALDNADEFTQYGDDITALLIIICGKLNSGEYAFDKAYDVTADNEAKRLASAGTVKSDKAAYLGACHAANVVVGLSNAMCAQGGEEVIGAAESKLRSLFESFVRKYGKAGKKQLYSVIDGIPGADKAFAGRLRAVLDTVKVQNGGFLSGFMSLFSKK